MYRIGQKTTLQERITIGKQVAAGRTDTQIAAKLDCSVWTVRKWGVSLCTRVVLASRAGWDDLEAADVAQSLTGGSFPQANRTDTPLPEAC